MSERKAYFKKQSPIFEGKPDENCNPEKKLKSVTKGIQSRVRFQENEFVLRAIAKVS